MRFAVFGAGAVGSYFGGRLAEAGNDVVFIARGKHLQEIQNNGLKVESVKGDFIVHPAQATDDPAGVGKTDVMIVGVKAWQVPEAAQAMRPMMAPDTCIIPLQNGVEAPAQLASVLGDDHVLAGMCKIISAMVAPGHIRHVGVEPYIAFGEMDNTASERVNKLRQIFETAGIFVETPPDIDIRAAMWEKFLFICPVSGLGAVTRATIGEMRDLPETRRMLQQMMQEIFDVAQGHNVLLSPDVINKTMAFLDSVPAEGTASMQRDIMEGRPSELGSQNGAVVRLGQEAGIETPLNSFIYHSLLLTEQKARKAFS